MRREQRNTVIRNRVALFLSAVFQPPVTVAVLLLLSPVVEPGFPGTAWFGALAVLFVCALPFAAVLLLVRLGKITDHHVSDRRQRAPVMGALVGGGVAAGLWLLLREAMIRAG